MSYGGRYVRMAAGDPGLFSGIAKTFQKVVAPITKVAGVVGKVPVLGSVLRAVPGVGTAMAVLDVGMHGIKAGKQALGAARAALGGSKITKGALTLNGKNLLPSRPGVGPVALAGGGTALGAAAGVQLMKGTKPSTQAQPARRRRARGATARKGKCGCPPGKRRVCFGKSTKGRRRSGAVSAKQAAARKRFAAAARRGPIRKGSTL